MLHRQKDEGKHHKPDRADHGDKRPSVHQTEKQNQRKCADAAKSQLIEDVTAFARLQRAARLKRAERNKQNGQNRRRRECPQRHSMFGENPAERLSSSQGFGTAHWNIQILPVRGQH